MAHAVIMSVHGIVCGAGAGFAKNQVYWCGMARIFNVCCVLLWFGYNAGVTYHERWYKVFGMMLYGPKLIGAVKWAH